MPEVPESPVRTGDQTPMEVVVRKATAADLPRVSAMLARAFDDDAFANWVCARDARRARRIYDSMAFAAERLTFPHGHVYTTDDHTGAALWTPPGKWKMGPVSQLTSLPALARCTTWRRIPQVMAGLNAVEKKHPHAPHYYLIALGVEPELQGRSIGTQLMAPVLATCDRDGLGAYLETSLERNVPLFERNGFRVREELVIPKGGPRTWLMWREPQ